MHCAINEDSAEENESGEVNSGHCPRCNGDYIKPEDKGRYEGIVAALSGGELELDFLKELSDEIAETLSKQQGGLISLATSVRLRG